MKQFDRRLFYVDSIIDNREFKLCVGFKLLGGNTVQNLIMKTGLDNELKLYFDKNIPFENSQIPVVLVINNFWLSEEFYNFKTTVKTFLDVDICIKESGKLYRINGLSKEYVIEGSKARKSHTDRIAAFFDTLFYNLNTCNCFNDGFEYRYGPGSKATHSILKTNDYKPGIYLSHNQLLKNSPVLDLSYKIKQKKDRYSLRIDTIDSPIHLTNYGFSDGKDLYINANVYSKVAVSYYTKVLSKGRYFLIDDYIRNPLMLEMKAVTLNLIGYLSELEGTRSLVAIEACSGQVFVLDETNMLILLVQYPSLLKIYEKKENHDIELKREMIKYINSTYNPN